MTLSRFFVDSPTMLIADASAVINLIATQQDETILQAIPHSFLVTDNAWAELEQGSRKGYREASRLAELASDGLARRVFIGDGGLSAYEDLISGSTASTLDDGEAATIAYACEVAGMVLVDERKARTICGCRYPKVEVVSSVELLLHPHMRRALGKEAQAEAVFSALKEARMHVPAEHVSSVISLIGVGRAKLCSSLPRIR